MPRPAGLGDIPNGLEPGLHRLLSSMKQRIEQLSGERGGGAPIGDGLILSAMLQERGVGTRKLGLGLDVKLNAGSVSAPSLAKNGDEDTGFYFPAANEIAAAVGGVQGWHLDSAGRVLKPNQPSFLAYRSGSGNHNAAHTAPLDTTDFNVGNHFNTTNYRFTAPVAGKYFFIFNAMNHQLSGVVCLGNIKKNGSTLDQTHQTGSHPQGFHGSLLLNLAKNDYIELQLAEYHYNATLRIPNFSGWLVG